MSKIGTIRGELFDVPDIDEHLPEDTGKRVGSWVSISVADARKMTIRIARVD